VALRRLRPPWPVTVQCDAGTPVRLTGAALSGRVVSWHGPFRRHAEWWRAANGATAAVNLEMYDVELGDGVFYRLHCEQPEQHWWVVGWYD
jgi:hypothetical protein